MMNTNIRSCEKIHEQSQMKIYGIISGILRRLVLKEKRNRSKHIFIANLSDITQIK